LRTTLALLLAFVACCGGGTTAPSGTTSGGTTGGTAATAAPASEDAGQVVATIGDEKITLGDVDKKAGAQLAQVRQQIFDIRKQALDGLVMDRLVSAEAKKRGITDQELLKAEVEDKVPEPTDAQVQELYDQNKARLGDQTLEQVKPRIVAFLKQKGSAQRMEEFSNELKEAAKVQISLEPPRVSVPVPDTAPRFGSASAPVQIIEFSDFECPYCSRAANTVTEIEKKYGDKVSVVYRYFPLEFHPHAQKAAEAAACANDQGKFWPYHDKLFANQKALEPASLEQYASELGLDTAAFKTCLESGKNAPLVAADLEAGKSAGVQGTPGFFVNGRFLGGALPIDQFSAIIDDELSRKPN
jgi:protein-disulfide isomerase